MKRVAIPSLGGWLTMLNVIVWLCLLLTIGPTRSRHASDDSPNVVVMTVMLVVSSPVAIFDLLSFSHGADPSGEWSRLLFLIGINAFIWGYGLAALAKGLDASLGRLRRFGKDRVHDLGDTPEAEPLSRENRRQPPRL